MRAAFSLIAAATLVLPLAGCDHHADVAGPSGIPYACADGRAARIHFDGGDPNRRPARLSFDGHDYEMAPDPAMSGLRYRSESGLAPGRGIVWTSEGEEAALIDVPGDPASADGEREIARCARVREGEAVAAEPEPHH